MKRTPLALRSLPNYTKGEELLNAMSHAVGAGFGIAALILCVLKAARGRDPYAVTASVIYGFSMIAELLCSITSAGATANHHVRRPGEGAGTCHAFIAIDPAIFGDADGMRERLSVFLQELRDAKRADESIPIYTHGEKEHISYERTLREGLDVDISTAAEMLKICAELGIDGEKYLGKIDVSGAKESIYDKLGNPNA